MIKNLSFITKNLSFISLLVSILCIHACVHQPKSILLPKAQTDQQKADFEKIDFQSLTQETKTFLQAYLQAPTINPPGNEKLGVDLIAKALDQAHISYQIVPLSNQDPSRASIFATIPASIAKDKKSNDTQSSKSEKQDSTGLCLLSHIDVVPADEQNWRHPAFSGQEINGEIWGRGALDMKGMGAIELMTFIAISRLKLTLKRSLTLIAVADEEVDNLGMKQLLDQYWDQLDCAYLINEGGIGLKDVLFENQNLFPISVGEKGVLWLKISVDGPSGHGSTPRSDFAPIRLLHVLDQISKEKLQLSFDDSLLELFYYAGQHGGGLKGFVMSRPSLLKSLGVSDLLKEPGARAALINTIHITGLDTGDHQPNVVPSRASATLDVRLLPGQTKESFLTYFKTLIPQEERDQLKIEVLSYTPAGFNDWENDPLYGLIVNQTKQYFQNAVPTPALSVGFTDSIYARQKNVKAFGFVPFLISKEEAQTMHGENERISTEQLKVGLRLLLDIVYQFTVN